MTREKEIRQEIDLRLAGSSGNYSEGYEEGFIEGAKWADETMIDKVCEWLEKNRDELSRVDTSGFIKMFKKAMEL